jgi:ribosomal protein S18 acetylase RimI-like enzyme
MIEHSIIPGQPPQDAEDFVKLFIISGPEYVPTLFAGTHEAVAGNSFRAKRNLLAAEHTHFVKVNGKNAGMMVAYNWTTRNQQLAKSFLLILRHMKIKFFLRIRPLWWSDDLSKFDENTFYISNLAFFPEFRNRELGSSLLSHIQEVARKSQAKRLDVDVETYN